MLDIRLELVGVHDFVVTRCVQQVHGMYPVQEWVHLVGVVASHPQERYACPWLLQQVMYLLVVVPVDLCLGVAELQMIDLVVTMYHSYRVSGGLHALYRVQGDTLLWLDLHNISNFNLR